MQGKRFDYSGVKLLTKPKIYKFDKRQVWIMSHSRIKELKGYKFVMKGDKAIYAFPRVWRVNSEEGKYVIRPDVFSKRDLSKLPPQLKRWIKEVLYHDLISYTNTDKFVPPRLHWKVESLKYIQDKYNIPSYGRRFKLRKGNKIKIIEV